jgi:hypothetical protein
MGVLKPGISQPEVVEAMIERLPGDADTQLTHVGEVRQADLAGFVGLAEDDLLLLAMNGPPGADPALQGATDSAPEVRMAPEHLLEDRDGAHAGGGLQHRHAPSQTRWPKSSSPRPISAEHNHYFWGGFVNHFTYAHCFLGYDAIALDFNRTWHKSRQSQ